MSLAEVLRDEIRQVIDNDKNFTIQTAARVERLASAARTMLAAAGGVPEAIAKVKDDQDIDINDPLTPSQAAETFGARLIQEAMAVLPKLLRRSDSDESLVHALVSARLHGMTDVAAELERKLVGHSLDGDRPVLALEPQPHGNDVSLTPGKVVSDDAGNGVNVSANSAEEA